MVLNLNFLKKYMLIFLLLSVVVVVSSCTAQKTAPAELSELQTSACNAAQNGGTCDTKLEDLGLVTKKECCSALGKCC